MAFHCNQPVFNFHDEIENAYRSAYLPLVDTLGEFPGIKASFHYSGYMLEWLSENHPDYIEKLKNLVEKGQIELIGGGCFEPVMALIPERDRCEQLEMNERIINRLFGVKSRGAWITERVWEPELIETLSSGGLEYAILDDYHLVKAGLEEDDIYSPCLTQKGEKKVTLFPALTPLRYFMPFRSPEAVIEYLKDLREEDALKEKCFFFADDGEKFGAWPYTYQWVHKKGWLKKFFHLLEENSDWLESATYSEVLDSTEPKKVGEVPESSYPEMMEWSGGGFKNFLKKYPEANRMHKRMISVSDMLEEASLDGSSLGRGRLEAAKKELFKAQTGCAYWHGTFGGLYLPHLRSGVYEHLIEAQNIIESGKATKGFLRSAERKLDGSRSEAVIENEFLRAFITSSGASLSELDYKPLKVNLVNTMSRKKEDYHQKLNKSYPARLKEARKALLRGELANVHDLLGVAEMGLGSMLIYDDYQRGSFLTHIFKDKRPWKKMRLGRSSYDSFLKGKYASSFDAGKDSITHVFSKRDRLKTEKGRPFDIEVIKKVRIGKDKAIFFTHEVLRDEEFPLRSAAEFNFLIWDKAVIARPILMETDKFSLKDMYSGVRLDFFLNDKFTIFSYPVYTVNETEEGLKKTFQGVSVIAGSENSSGEMKIRLEIN